MNICYFGSDYPPTGGGISTYVVNWLASVSKSPEITKIDAYIFGNKSPRTERVNSKLFVTITKDNNFFTVGFKILYFMFINRKARVFHAFYLFPIGFWMVIWSKLFKVPTIITIYGTDACSREGSWVTRNLKRFTLMQTNKIISISEFTKEATIRALSLTKDKKGVEVIYNTVPKVETRKKQIELEESIKELKAKFSINENTFAVLSVCRLVKRKGVRDLIEAIASISDSNVKLLIVGDGPERKNLEKLIFEKQLQNKAFLLGKIHDLVPFYKISKVVALSSFARVEEGDFEGLGLVLLEAQSFGLPVIGTNSGGIPETFAHGETGLLVPEKDYKALGVAIETLYKDNNLYKAMSSESRHFLENRFGLNRMLNEYMDLIHQISA